MIDLGASKQINGMSINMDKSKDTLNLSQEKYIRNVLKKFSLQDAKIKSVPLGSHLNLTKKQSPQTDEAEKEINEVSCVSAIGSLMFAMVCMGLDIVHAVEFVNKFMSKTGKEHWRELSGYYPI